MVRAYFGPCSIWAASLSHGMLAGAPGVLSHRGCFVKMQFRAVRGSAIRIHESAYLHSIDCDNLKSKFKFVYYVVMSRLYVDCILQWQLGTLCEHSVRSLAHF